MLRIIGGGAPASYHQNALLVMFFRRQWIRVKAALAALASRATGWAILALAGLVFAAPVAAQDAWPAEAIGASTNLTTIEGGGQNDFHLDLSAAVWNPVTESLWLGRNGLMFVGHQNGGAVYVFDLNRDTIDFIFVGEYLTGQADTSGLEFDRSTGQLYVWHDRGIDILSVSDLTSTPVSNGVRQLNITKSYDGPASQNNEGIAVLPAGTCVGGERSFFMTIDDGGNESLRWYQQFTDGCEVAAVPSMGLLGLITVAVALLGLGLLERPRKMR